jgi:hypothetical protein
LAIVHASHKALGDEDGVVGSRHGRR